MWYLLVLPFLFLVIVLIRTFKIVIHYVEARRFGIPIVVTPISQREIWWVLIRRNFQWVEHLPLGLGAWYPYTNPGWPVKDRCKSHKKYGEAFVIVSPNTTHISLASPEASERLYSDWRNWITVPEITKIFGICGENILMANGEDWQRHRKVMAAAFTEKNLRLVWSEAKRQTDQMLPILEGRQGIWRFSDIREDIEVLALHVLAAAAFGSYHDYTGGVKNLPLGHQKTFVEALGFILNNFFLALLSMSTNVSRSFLPGRLKLMKDSIAEFKTYLSEMIAEQQEMVTDKPLISSNLLAAMVNATEEEKRVNLPGKRFHLNKDEIMGNLFFINMAGQVTTASTLIYTLAFLAIHPEIQEWARDEVDRVVSERGLDSYNDTFSSMGRCLSLMHETLRMFSPVIQVTRMATNPQTLPLKKGELRVPPKVHVSAEQYAMHLDTALWGDDADTYYPQRWMEEDEKTGTEKFGGPAKGAIYLPWLSGPRKCPGAKFSQVEFCCVIGTLLSQYQVVPLIIGNETKEEAHNRLVGSIMESDFRGTPRPNRPEEIGVKLNKRD